MSKKKELSKDAQEVLGIILGFLMVILVPIIVLKTSYPDIRLDVCLKYDGCFWYYYQYDEYGEEFNKQLEILERK